jgi:ABC-type multidrug transport system fused ATPase/permease subunit
MLKAIKQSLAFMTPNERSKWYLLTGLRALLSLLDLVGILAIGFVVTSTAIFLTEGSNPNRVLDVVGLQIPAVNAQTLPWVAGFVLALFILKALVSILLLRRAAYFVSKIEARAARTIAEIALGGDLGSARERSREDVMFAVQAGSPAAFNILLNAANTLLTEATLFLLICVGFFLVNPAATFAAIFYFGIVAFLIQFFLGSLMIRAGEIAAKSTIEANMAISDLLSVFRELVVAGKQHKYIDGIYRARLSAAESSANTYFLNGMPRYIIEASLLVGVTLFVLAQALTGDIVTAAGTLGVFLTGGFRLTASLLPLQSALLTIKSFTPAANSAHRVLAETKTRESRPNNDLGIHEVEENKAQARPSSVIFENVTFKYSGAAIEALSDVSFEIQPGSQVGLIGPSGAGKSTIADLMCGVLVPTSGVIKINTDNSHGVPTHTNVTVGYVPQHPGMVSGTLAENVALGETQNEINREAVKAALDAANLTETISGLSEGIDTQLGKLQDGLSGGQMQRIGLARALYLKPSLLVMDEATSALDAKSEGEIRKALDAMKGKVTLVIIAHRLNTIQHVDEVFYMEQGGIKDSGKFQDLVTRNPSLARTVALMKVQED